MENLALENKMENGPIKIEFFSIPGKKLQRITQDFFPDSATEDKLASIYTQIDLEYDIFHEYESNLFYVKFKDGRDLSQNQLDFFIASKLVKFGESLPRVPNTHSGKIESITTTKNGPSLKNLPKGIELSDFQKVAIGNRAMQEIEKEIKGMSELELKEQEEYLRIKYEFVKQAASSSGLKNFKANIGNSHVGFQTKIQKKRATREEKIAKENKSRKYTATKHQKTMLAMGCNWNNSEELEGFVSFNSGIDPNFKLDFDPRNSKYSDFK